MEQEITARQTTDHKISSLEINLPAELSPLLLEFSSFNAFYACFCDTLANVLVAGQPLDACTVEGVNRSCRWLEHRLVELQAELESIAEQS